MKNIHNSRQIWIHDQKMYAGKKIYDKKSACREIQDPKSARGEIITQKNRTNRMFL